MGDHRDSNVLAHTFPTLLSSGVGEGERPAALVRGAVVLAPVGSAVVAAAGRAHAGDALDGDLDGDRAGLLEGEGEGEALAFVQRLLQAYQHEVVAARP